MKAKKHIDWNYFHSMCEKLANKVKHANFKAVYGIPRGGLIPATIISHYLDIPLLTEYDDENTGVYDVLVIDDIADSGNTLKELNYLRRRATLFVNKERCKHYPDFFVEETDEWVVFPYEYNKDTVSQVRFKDNHGHIHRTSA
jgi:hypoxanthine phosphoribosyltransferase